VVGGELYITTSDGSRSELVTSSTLALHLPRWAPDGNTIYYLRRKECCPNGWPREIYKVSRDSSGWGTPQLVFSGTGRSETPTSLDLSPDGSYVVYSTKNLGGPFYALDVATPGSAPEPVETGIARNESPSFSPDLNPQAPGFQGRIVFEGLDDVQGTSDLHVMEGVSFVAGSPISYGTIWQLTLTGQSVLERSPVWSPVSSEVAIHNVVPGGVQVMDVDTLGTRDVCCGSAPTWSSDGIYFAYPAEVVVRKRKRSFDLFRLRSDGSESSGTNITEGHGRWELDPDWSPAWVNDLGD